MKLLTYSNAIASTGFACVWREIFTGLLAEGVITANDLCACAINFHGGPTNSPFANVWPAQGPGDPDPFGRGRFATNALSNAWPFDILWALEDPFTLAWNVPFPPDGRLAPFMPTLLVNLREMVTQGKRPPFRVVQYIPIDSEHCWPEWITWIADLVDYPVAYTEFGKRVMCDIAPSLKDRLRVIPHGTSPETFFPIADDERDALRKQWFQCERDDWLLINVNRNQPRKDIPRTLQVFRDVLKTNPQAKLYLHMNMADSAGFNLERVRHALRIPQGRVIYPGNFNEGSGFPLSVLNQMMNCADIYLSTARGEGWGLNNSDFMCIGRPIVAPDHTSHRELLGDGRGMLVPSESEYGFSINDLDQPRPVASVPDMAAACVRVLDDKVLAKQIGATARAWALQHTWRQHVVPQWVELLREAERSMQPAVATAPAVTVPRRLVLNAERLESAGAVG